MSLPRLWVVNDELIHATRLGDMHVAGTIELVNGQNLWDREMAFGKALPKIGPHPEPWTADFPRPYIRLDDPNYAPDLFRLENWWFISCRLLGALDLEPDDANLLPATFSGDCAAARAAGYHLMRNRRFTNIVDYDASDCEWQWGTAAKTGEPYRDVRWLGRICFRLDVAPPSSLFEDIAAHRTLATDALAVRVLTAGCTGIEFVHPLWFNEVGIKVVRSATGVEKHIYADDEWSFQTIPMTWEEADAGPDTAPTTGIADYIRSVSPAG